MKDIKPLKESYLFQMSLRFRPSLLTTLRLEMLFQFIVLLALCPVPLSFL